jgi:hypothetical protein
MSPDRGTGRISFALQHAIDKRTGRRGAPLCCCFVDLTAAFDSVPREVLWQRLHPLGVPGRMLSTMQALYAGAKLAIKVEGRVGEVAYTHGGPSVLPVEPHVVRCVH